MILFICLFTFFSIAGATNFVKLTQLNTDDGLIQNGINQIIQDKDGFLWIATAQGLNRYDGYRISTIKSPNSLLKTDSIAFLWEDSKGLIWISTANNNNNFVLNKSKNTLTPIILDAPEVVGMTDPTILNAVEDQNSNIWVSTYEEIFFYNRSNNSFSFKLSLKSLFDDPKGQTLIRSLLMLKSNLLIASSNGLYLYDLETNKVNLIPHIDNTNLNIDNNNIKSLHINSKHQILIGTVEGLFQINETDLNNFTNPKSFKQIVNELNIWEIIEKPNFYYLATNEGLFKLNFQNELTHVFRFSDLTLDSSDDDIVSMIEDREGVLWFGSKNDGVFKWHPNQAIKKHYWTNSKTDNQLSNDIVLDIHRDKEERIWIATENGLNKISKEGKVIDRLFVNLDKKVTFIKSSILSIAENEGQLWLNTNDGIKVINKETGESLNRIFPKTKHNIFNQKAVQLFFSSPNRLFIVGYDATYLYDLIKNEVTLIEFKKGVAGWNGVFFETPTGKSDTYFLAGPNKLYQYSLKSGMYTTFHSIEHLTQYNSTPADVHRQENELWVTYFGVGVFILDATTGKKKHFISEKEMHANTLMDIFSDKKKNIWITSNDGLFKLNRNTYSFQKFDRYDGFITSEFNGDTSQTLPSGEVLLGSIKGAFLFDPNLNDSKDPFTISSKITKVSLLSSELPAQYSDFHKQTIIMEHDDFGLTVNFSALLLASPEQVKYSYWMEGDSTLSKTMVNRSELFFPSFSSGKRTLFISAHDYRTGENSSPISITIINKPPLYLSLYAKIFYSTLILLIFSFIFWSYKRRRHFKELAFQEIKQSEERLNLALQGGNSGLWDWYARNNQVYEPRLAKLSLDSDKGFVPFRSRISAIFIEDQSSVLSKWHEFRHGNIDVFDCTYRMQNENKKWIWYRDIAMVSEFDTDNKPIRVTGTYTNINEKQKSSEQIQLFSKAFENSLDIIVILNDKREITATNNAFLDITRYSQNEMNGSNISALLGSSDNNDIYPTIFSEIDKNRQWKGEAILIGKNAVKISTLVSATIFFASNTTQYYVFSISDISKQKQAENNLKKLVNYDPLTGLPNRALLLDRISDAISASKQNGKKLAIFFIDLDRFKQVNDSLGHDVGDAVLTRAAKILKNCCRADDTASRLGGDEFVVMLKNIEGDSTINRVLTNILEQVKKPFFIDNNQISISASIGVSIYPKDAEDPKTLLKHADIAMYHAKENGRSHSCHFRDYMNAEVEVRLSLETKLRIAVGNNEIQLAYQPQFDLISGELCGVEALARWTNNYGEVIPPSVFIPIAEELGLIIPMTEYLLPLAMNQISLWNNKNRNVKLAFNLSACHVYDKSFIPFIESQIENFPNVAKILELELTESILMTDIDKALEVFNFLKKYNIDLALDDFGTGYSSLKYLTSLPISKLKIDMSFVQKIGKSQENDVIIHAIISLAKSLNLSVVAEGVETKKQLDFLKNGSVNYAQGYLFSKPMQAKDIESLLSKNIYD